MRVTWLSKARVWVTGLVITQAVSVGAVVTAAPSAADITSSSKLRAGQLQQIQTETTFRNGRTLVNSGVGFVLGNLFFTVNHNLDPGYRVNYYDTQSYLAGIPVEAIAVDETNDLAVIRIPPALCTTWCNELRIPHAARIGLQQKVEWLAESANSGRWQQAKVLSITRPDIAPTYLAPSTACQRGLVVEVTQPFPPGTSGTAVWDPLTHELLGMAQGSYERANGNVSGYFKPLACIIEHLQAHGLNE